MWRHAYNKRLSRLYVGCYSVCLGTKSLPLMRTEKEYLWYKARDTYTLSFISLYSRAVFFFCLFISHLTANYYQSGTYGGLSYTGWVFYVAGSIYIWIISLPLPSLRRSYVTRDFNVWRFAIFLILVCFNVNQVKRQLFFKEIDWGSATFEESIRYVFSHCKCIKSVSVIVVNMCRYDCN